MPDADDLYRLPPEEFTAARDAAVKAAGKADKAALKALRRPTVSAWLVDQLAREEPALLDQLLALGPELARAQSGGAGEELRRLGAQRRELVEAVVDRAVELGGRDVTAAVREEVAGTLEAALADSASADAVRSGRLVRPLSYAGFGGVDLEGAVAPGGAPAPRKTPKPHKADDREQRIAAAETAAHEAAGRLDDAVRAAEQAQQAEQRAQDAVDEATQERDAAAEALERARAALDEATASHREAARTAEQAVAKARRAQDAEEQARSELDRLRRS